MIIPDVYLRNLTVEGGKRFRGVPASVSMRSVRTVEMQYRDKSAIAPFNIVVEIIIIAGLAEFLWEGVVPPLLRVGDVGPRPQGTVHPDAIVIDLVTAADPTRLRSPVSFVSLRSRDERSRFG